MGKIGKAFRFAVAGDGTPSVEVVDFDGTNRTLDEIYRIGGWEMTEVGAAGKYGETSVVLWCDEEGLYREPVIVNRSATDFRNELLGRMLDPLVGTCVLTAEDTDTGETIAFTDEQVAEITKLLDYGGYPLA